MDHINFQLLKRVLIVVVAGLASEKVMAEYDCAKLDPRVKLSAQTEVEVSGSAETVYKIAKAGGKVTVGAKSAAQNIQETVPISEEANAQNRLLYLLCEMMSKEDIPADKKIELYKYLTDKISSSKSIKQHPARAGDKPKTEPAKKSDVSESKSVVRNSTDPKNSDASPNDVQVVEKKTSKPTDSSTGKQPVVVKPQEAAKTLTFTQDCKEELQFEYTKYKQSSKFPYQFIYVRNNGVFNCDECVGKLVEYITSMTGIPIKGGTGANGVPGCLGYREDIGGSLKGAQCLQALLGENYHLNRDECSTDGFPYSVKLRK